MRKQTAINALGGTQASTARHLGIKRQAVFKWPDPLSSKIADKVRAAMAAKKQPKEKQA